MQQGEDVVVHTARDIIEAIDEDPLGAPDPSMTDTAEQVFQVEEEEQDHTEVGVVENTFLETGGEHADSEKENTELR